MTGPQRFSDATTAADLVVDEFDDDRAAGRVVGSRTAAGHPRAGTDRQRVIAIDGGAARIRPLPRPGWGRAVLSYGPFRPAPGLVLVVFVLNGHNSSQTHHIALPLWKRVRRILGDVRRRRLRLRVLKDNLAVGWFDRAVPTAPTAGATFLMRSADEDGGDLRTLVGGKPLSVQRGVQNVPFYYVVALRERGAAYYLASLEAVPGTGVFPELRPVGIDTSFQEDPVHAAVCQAVLGEIDFRADTRVYGVRVTSDPALQPWCQQAHAAARTVPPASGAAAGERGGRWTRHRGPAGLTASILDPGAPSSVVHVMLDAGGQGAAGLAWRVGGRGGWYVVVGHRECELFHRSAEGIDRIATTATPPTARGADQRSLQVVDDGSTFAVVLDGAPLFDRRFDPRGEDGTGVGVVSDGGRGLRELEAHPTAIDGRHLLTLGAPWTPRPTSLVVVDHFEGGGPELQGRATTDGPTWSRTLGAGRIVITEAGGAAVDADLGRPNPGRTLYTVPWTGGPVADLTATVTPPGRARWQGHAGRAGVVFWQDEDNYLVVGGWLDDSPGHDGSSVSAFVRLRGQEDPYDAVWSNVGRAITWGVAHRLRVCFDGDRFLAWVDDRPVLYRAVRDVHPTAAPLRIERVGLSVNWEYGNDTGSTFHEFVARNAQDPAPSPA